MDPEIPYRFFNMLKNDHFSIVYMGEFNDELTTSLIRLNETDIHEPQKFKNKFSFLIAESFQNIIRHADKPDIINRTNNKPKMFLVRNIGKTFYIASTNLINNEKTAELSSRLKSINTSTKEELKAVYLDALANNEFSSKGGAGLGLIEMAKKSDCGLEFDFEFVNYFLSVFYIQLKIKASNDPKEDDPNDNITLADTKKFYNALIAENVFMIRKGDFSQEYILPLLELIEKNMKSQQDASVFQKKTLYLLIELFQNISKHASRHNTIREGIFIITLKNNRYTIHTGNYIDTGKVESLKDRLKNLINMDQDGLAEMYKKNLLKKDPAASAGIGLIEVCKYSSEKLKYNFKPVTDALSFFSLSITV